jgi:hypothetical protein
MKYFALKRALSYYGFDYNSVLANKPLRVIRPWINFYCGSCWTEIPDIPPVLFIHIPKNAGSSVMKAIYGRASGHCPAFYYMANDENQYKQRITFSIVRNPYDRFVSIFYHYLSSPSRSPWEENIGKSFFSRYSGPNELADAIRANLRIKSFYQTLTHSKPQIDWLMVEGKISVQYLFPFERMNKLEKFLQDILQDPSFCLPHINASKRSIKWQDQISPATKQLIEKLYKDDIQLWESIC